MGRFLRGIHHWASAALIILAVLTIARMFFGGEFEAQFGAVKQGGRNFIQVAKIVFQIGVSRD